MNSFDYISILTTTGCNRKLFEAEQQCRQTVQYASRRRQNTSVRLVRSDSAYDPSDANTFLLTIKSCSIACYKSHKPVHAAEEQTPATPTPLTATSVIPVDTAAESKPKPRRRPGGNKPDFTDFDNDPVLADLLRKYPKLRIQLQSVYGLMLEPASAGRGFRGGNWTPAKGESEAVERLGRLREQEGEEGGVAEFCRRVDMRYGTTAE